MDGWADEQIDKIFIYIKASYTMMFHEEMYNDKNSYYFSLLLFAAIFSNNWIYLSVK